MEKIKSKIIPLPRRDIDTDLIIPAEFLMVTDKKGLGKYVFSRVREMEKDFPFNLEEFSGCEILVVRENFGCGSSREHAAWALSDWGIKVIIAPSFADIFYNNALKNNILPIVASEGIVEEMLKGGIAEIDLPQQKVIFGDTEFSFEIDPYRKECLIHGMDDMDYLLSASQEIKAFDKKHKKYLFFDLKNL